MIQNENIISLANRGSSSHDLITETSSVILKFDNHTIKPDFTV